LIQIFDINPNRDKNKDMKKIVQFKISKGEAYYVAESFDLPIVTQGKTLDETVKNIEEAVDLHFEDTHAPSYDLARQPAVLS